MLYLLLEQLPTVYCLNDDEGVEDKCNRQWDDGTNDKPTDISFIITKVLVLPAGPPTEENKTMR